jgi:hypothetical protein
MSEWRGILHPRDRRGQFRQSLERLASAQPAQSRVSFGGGAIARDRRGYFRSEAAGHPSARHRSARAAVDRLIAVGKASPPRYLFAGGWQTGSGRFKDLPAGTVKKLRVAGTQRYEYHFQPADGSAKRVADSPQGLAGKPSPAASVAEFEALRRRYERAPVIASADPVARAAQALANLYRAQESGRGQGRAKASVTESWRGLDLRQRSRAKLLARHLVSA